MGLCRASVESMYNHRRPSPSSHMMAFSFCHISLVYNTTCMHVCIQVYRQFLERLWRWLSQQAHTWSPVSSARQEVCFLYSIPATAPESRPGYPGVRSRWRWLNGGGSPPSIRRSHSMGVALPLVRNLQEEKQASSLKAPARQALSQCITAYQGRKFLPILPNTRILSYDHIPQMYLEPYCE